MKCNSKIYDRTGKNPLKCFLERGHYCNHRAYILRKFNKMTAKQILNLYPSLKCVIYPPF